MRRPPKEPPRGPEFRPAVPPRAAAAGHRLEGRPRGSCRLALSQRHRAGSPVRQRAPARVPGTRAMCVGGAACRHAVTFSLGIYGYDRV